jgi:hypothetical protein
LPGATFYFFSFIYMGSDGSDDLHTKSFLVQPQTKPRKVFAAQLPEPPGLAKVPLQTGHYSLPETNLERPPRLTLTATSAGAWGSRADALSGVRPSPVPSTGSAFFMET